MILPQEFIPAAEQAGLMSTIDNVLLFRCVQIVRKLMKQDRRVGIFCNLSVSALWRTKASSRNSSISCASTAISLAR